MNEPFAAVARRWWLIPVLVGVLAGSAAVNVHETADHRPWAVVLAGAAALVLFGVDRWPWAVLLNGLLVGGYFTIGGENGPASITVVIAAFLVATRREPRRWLPLLVASGTVVTAGLLVRGLREQNLGESVWQSLGTSGLIAAAAAVATTVRARGQARSDRARRAATEEKLRMAQDLHDGVGHGLAVIAMQAGVALHVLDRDPSAVRGALEAIRETSKEALESLRIELSQLAGEPGRRTPRRGLADLPDLAGRVEAAGLSVRLEGDLAVALTDAVDAAAYAIAQEALTNVLRHAQAATVSLRVERGRDTLVVTVTDDGRGGPVQHEGMGLSGMRQRAEAVGGSLAAGPRDGGGFEVRAVLPVRPA